MIDWKEVQRQAREGSPQPDRRVEKSDAEWKDLLSGEAFKVARRAGTERPFSSPMCTSVEPGQYECVCCGELLFDAETKFESGTGWPSFTAPVRDNVVSYHEDSSFGMSRMEALCAVCDAHLGHVFPDGPEPTGLRYCMNAVSLRKRGA